MIVGQRLIRVAGIGVVFLALALAGCSGCNEQPLDNAKADAGLLPGGLTPEQARAVVARVGERTITLGDYAAALERLNQFDRLRFQTTKRRREFLERMIDLELLAQEARRRGLDNNPEVQAAIRQRLREVQLQKAHRDLPQFAQIPDDEIKAYYEEHKEDYREPERRGVAVITLGDPDKAAEVLELAKNLESDAGWGDLVFEHSLDAPTKRDPNAPAEFQGELGLVGPPGDAKAANARVPVPVQSALFELGEVGDIHDAIVVAANRYYVVRMTAKTDGHVRTLKQAERGIRVAILQRMAREREEQMLDALRERFGVTIDERALASVKLPDGYEKIQLWEEDLPPAAGDPDADETKDEASDNGGGADDAPTP